MGFTVISVFVAVLIRIPALYVALSHQGFHKIEVSNLFLLAMFSALLGVIMPAGGILDIGGVLFRVGLFSLMLMVMMRLEFFEGLTTTIIAAIIEAIIIAALLFTPFSWLVEGMSVLTIP
jgi:hypothetical protein